MAYRGVDLPRELKPAEFGIFSAARVNDHTGSDADHSWVRGFSYEYDSRPTVRLLEDTGSSVHVMYDGTGVARYQEYKSFFIEVEDFRSTFSLAGEDRFARVLKQLDAASQKAVERELQNGYVARTDATPNIYLAKNGAATILGAATGHSVEKALLFIEDAMSNSPTGEQGVLHITRGIAALLGSQWLLMRVEDDNGKFHIETINGTTTVVGSGYTGDGPFINVTNKALNLNVATITTATSHYLKTGDTVTVSGVDATFNGTYTVASAPTDTTFTYNKTAGNVGSTASTGLVQMNGSNTSEWIYATGCVDVHLGKVEVVNDSLAQGYGVSANQNDMRIKALRPAAAYFDPSIHYAVKVDLTV